MKGMPRSAAMRWMASAMVRTCASPSMTQGPAMRKSWPAPTCTGPISKEWLTKAILLCRGEAPRPLPEPSFQSMERRRAGQIALRLDDVALGQPLAEGQILHIKPDIVPRVPQRFQRTIIQHRIPLRVDRGQNRGGNGNVDAAQPDKSLDSVLDRNVRRSGHGHGRAAGLARL